MQPTPPPDVIPDVPQHPSLKFYPPVTLLLVNWNGIQHLRRFLHSVVHTDYPALRIIMVDNASTDGSVEYVRAQYPQVELLLQPTNLGFAGGNNIAIPHIQTPYFVALNTDVEVPNSWLKPLIEAMEANPRLATVQPRILSQQEPSRFDYAGAAGGFMDRYGYAFCRGRVFHSIEQDNGQYNTPADLFWTGGACMVIRTAVVHQIGLFDEAFFAHWEEIDFCWRAQNAGWQHGIVPTAAVYHVGGGSLAHTNPRKTYLNFRNSLLTILKNVPPRDAFVMILRRLVLDGLAGINELSQGKFSHVWAIIRAHFAFYAMAHTVYKNSCRFHKRKLRSLQGVHNGSVVWAYFFGHKRKFSEIWRQNLSST